MRLNDLMKTSAVKRVFGEAIKGLPLFSIKSMVGHLIGAAGAVKAVGFGPDSPSRRFASHLQSNLSRSGVRLGLRAPNSAREIHVDTAVSTSFDLGGQNAALVMKRFRK
jgi:3-oxoacyl-[acyl-carrier-protein] synthase II